MLNFQVVMAPSTHIPTATATAVASVTPHTNYFITVGLQWINPSDILTVLMIIGGDIIKTALAQLAGGYIVPVSFSFGWVAYSFSTLLSAFGLLKLMPSADFRAKVINVENGYERENESWILGRLLRDHSYFPNLYRSPGRDVEDGNGGRKSGGGALLISVYGNNPEKKARVPDRDWLWWSGIAVAVLQHIIAIIPALRTMDRNTGRGADWTILLVTAWGTLLAFLGGALPQWKVEKWACRETPKDKKKTVAITQGNGSRHVIVIKCEGGGLNFEDLATSWYEPQPYTRIVTTLFAVLWIALLITVHGVSQNGWYLMGIGSIGMIQNVVAAGAARSPSAFGVHLESRGDFCEKKAMKTLLMVERAHPGVGEVLLPVFFPGKLREDEVREWVALRQLKIEKSESEGKTTKMG